MHVVHLSDVLPPGLGGVETALSTLLGAMPDVQFTILASSAALRVGAQFPKNVRILPLELKEIVGPLFLPFPRSIRRNSGLLSYPLHEWERRNRVATISPDVVHIHSYSIFRYFANLATGKGGAGARRLLDWLRDFEAYGPAVLFTDHSLFGGNRNQFDSIKNGLLVEKLRNIVCVEQSGKANVDAFARERGLELKTWWIPNPIDTVRFAPAPMPDRSRLVVGYAGRFEKRGMQDVMRLIRDAPDWVEFRLVLAGDEALQHVVEQQARGRFVHLKFNVAYSEMPAFYNSVHLFIDPWSFGAPRTSLEALSCGRPVVRLSRPESTAELPEEIAPIVGDADSTSVFERLAEFREDRTLETVGAAARRFAEENLSVARVVDAYRSVYQFVSRSN